MSDEKLLELQFSSKFGYFGSKEHFFHYYWGYVLPGMHTAISATKRAPGKYRFILEDCGPVMNKVALELFGMISEDITFQKHEAFSSTCTQVPRWDIMINFDSVLFEDEHSFRGSTKEYRENEHLLSVLNQPGFLQQFQSDMREVRSWVLERVIGPEAADSGIMRPKPRKKGSVAAAVDEPQMTGSAPVRAVKKSIIKFLELKGPRPVRALQDGLRTTLERRKRAMGEPVLQLTDQRTPKKKRARRKPKCLLLCRSPEPEYYSETGGAEAKKYGASRRTLVDIEETHEFLTLKGHNVKLYEPGSATIAEQIKEFYTSKVVIGIKGAELSNVFWMRPGSKMFVVTPSTMRSTPVYQRFARFLGVHCVSIYAKDGNNPSLFRLRQQIDDQM